MAKINRTYSLLLLTSHTIAAMKEARQMYASPDSYKKYNSVDSMMEDILGEV